MLKLFGPLHKGLLDDIWTVQDASSMLTAKRMVSLVSEHQRIAGAMFTLQAAWHVMSCQQDRDSAGVSECTPDSSCR